MKRIGILSDTHSYWDDRYLLHFSECDEIWHAGDICDPSIIENLRQPFGTDEEGNPKTRIVETATEEFSAACSQRFFAGSVKMLMF